MKYAFAALLLAGIAFSLHVSVDNYTAIESGKTAYVNLTIYNDENIDGYVFLSTVYSTMANIPSFYDGVFTMSPYETARTKFLVNASGIAPGKYSVTISANFMGEDVRKTVTIDVYAPVRIESVYRSTAAKQGDFVAAKFVIENQGSTKRNFAFDQSSFPEEFQAAYPQPFNLEPNESAEADVYLTVPYSFLGSNDYDVRVNSGEFSDSAKFRIVVSKGSAEPVFRILNYSLSALGKRGYELTLILSSRENFGSLKIAGLPLSWSILENNFGINASETKEVNVSVIPESFEEQIFEVLVVDGATPLAGTLVIFSGSKVGITGYALLSGSFTLGLLFAVIIVLVIFVVRQKNMFSELLEESKTYDYFEKLVQKAKDELGFGGEAQVCEKKKPATFVLEAEAKAEEGKESSKEEKMINEILEEEGTPAGSATVGTDKPSGKRTFDSAGDGAEMFSKKTMRLDGLLKKNKKVKKAKNPESFEFEE